ncbi:hypothetical protein BCF33_1457 [Hasllibacter halocynthiae]|uniref:Uncharacterized protein n=1 Tax=Hasllibacter halocynthiae TaxID=595589 RepID=A0A2T0X110_9RHOB|nr:DUF6653 family protein [Hasllibacter halocynthiae]PRY92607.1 hypothetical protein BCF33_1457 [Hasllibacter halocynthiae]
MLGPGPPPILDAALRGGAGAMRMDDATWRRHANPWSVWTRILTPLPLLTVVLFLRPALAWWTLLPLAVVLAWIVWNPRAFPEPKAWDGWPQRGVLGEKAMIAHAAAVPGHHRRTMTVLTGLSAVTAVI